MTMQEVVANILNEYSEETGHDTDYRAYILTFQLMCAIRKHVDPKAYEKNKNSNQDDLLYTPEFNAIQAELIKLV